MTGRNPTAVIDVCRREIRVGDVVVRLAELRFEFSDNNPHPTLTVRWEYSRRETHAMTPMTFSRTPVSFGGVSYIGVPVHSSSDVGAYGIIVSELEWSLIEVDK